MVCPGFGLDRFEEDDDQHSDIIRHLDFLSDDEGLGVLDAEVATARARREEQEAIERLAKARRARWSNSSALSVRTVRSSHSVRSAISSELLLVPPDPPALPAPQTPLAPQAPPAPQAPQASVISKAPQAPQAPTGLVAQPTTAEPHVPELPTSAAQSSWRYWFALGDHRVSVQDRIALLERATTRSDPASDHGHGVPRFLFGEHDLELKSTRMRVQELESARMRVQKLGRVKSLDQDTAYYSIRPNARYDPA